MKLIKNILFVILLLAVAPAYAQEQEEELEEVFESMETYEYEEEESKAADSSKFDKSAVEARQPAEETINNYKSDDDFDYTASYEEDIGWWERFIRWLKKVLGLDFDYEKSKTVLEFLKWAIIIIAAGSILYFVFKNEMKGLFAPGKGPGAHILDATYLDLNLSDDSLETLLYKAIEQKNYKEAVRLYYIKTLKELTNAGLITFTTDKTNREYLIEIAQDNIKAPFKELTYYFEYVFYGDFPATENILSLVQENYNKLKSLQPKATAQ